MELLFKKDLVKISFPEEELQPILQYYENYKDRLQEIQQIQNSFFANRHKTGLVPQLCDLEAEMTYLRIRAYKPSVVVEISPASGWSTSWILHALKDNGSGMLYSYDLVDDSTKVVPPQLSEGRWKFFQGDIRKNLQLLPRKAEYLFIDFDHSAEFGNWYIGNLVPMYGKGTKVSVHDILKWADEPGWGEESVVLCNWLLKRGVACITASRILKEKGYNPILETRTKLELDSTIQELDYNSMIFFEL